MSQIWKLLQKINNCIQFSASQVIYWKFAQKYALVRTHLKDLFIKEARFYWDDIGKAYMSLVLKNLGIKPVLGEDAHEAQVIASNVASMPSAREVRKLAVGTITSGKRQKLPLKGAAC